MFIIIINEKWSELTLLSWTPPHILHKMTFCGYGIVKESVYENAAKGQKNLDVPNL